eukprot:TRINITY_DN9495_c0_g2_i1.p1 TRINITY_DN9495_c0_g2~~TRINITY_DN9495_c0_g2_i1.p1  ORF type:complete len:264 (+),score=26.55 TRINITY_DN9495_c0_g2_i1:185-976(+)
MNVVRHSVDKSVALRWLGRQTYAESLRIQEDLASKLRASENSRDTLLLVEHSHPVITMGRRDTSSDLLVPEADLAAAGTNIMRTNRGGKLTWHGPGQLVGYPLLNLCRHTKSVRWYVEALQRVLLATFQDFGLRCQITEDVGVWVGDSKVAAIGVSVSDWVTMHGFALNVSNDLNAYKAFVPCGLHNKSVTSLSRELGRPVTIDEVVPRLLRHFGDRFECVLQADAEAESSPESPETVSRLSDVARWLNDGSTGTNHPTTSAE